MKQRRVFALFYIPILLLSLAMPVLALEPMEVLAGSAVLMDWDTGEVLYDQKAHEKAFPASTTKLMTALLVLDALDAGTMTTEQMIAIPETAWEGVSGDASNQNLRVGETMSLLDLLYCLLLPSANEAANTIAVAVGGDIPTFVEAMNDRARQLGCETTHFVNPHGLHDDQHYSSPYDLACILRECLTHPLFVQIVGTPAYTTAPTELSPSRQLHNSNCLIASWYYTGYLYSNAVGGKTGYTGKAGRCLATAAQEGEEKLISVVLGAENVVEEDGRTNCRYFSESARLLQWGFDNFEQTTISPGEDAVATLPITGGDAITQIPLYAAGRVMRTLPVDFPLEQLEADIQLTAPSMEAPITAGQILGTYTLSYQGEVYGTFDLRARDAVAKAQVVEELPETSDPDAQGSSPVLAIALFALLVVAVIALFALRHTRRKLYR